LTSPPERPAVPARPLSSAVGARWDVSRFRAIAQAKDDLRQIVIQAGQLLNRAEESRAEVLAEVESLRADLQLMRTQVGSATGIDLSSR
jgi:hypothetical protein